MRRNTEEKFWSLIDKAGGPDSCWSWQGCRDHGYGKYILYGKVWLAHRLVFWLATGQLPPIVCHKCDNPPCCNPNHIFAGDLRINRMDCVKKGRHARGETQNNAKLTDDQVRDIRSRVISRLGDQVKLAREFGVSKTTIGYVLQRRIWKHIGESL